MKKKSLLIPIFFISIGVHLLFLLILFYNFSSDLSPLAGGGGQIEIVGLRPVPTSPLGSTRTQPVTPAVAGNTATHEGEGTGEEQGSHSGLKGESQILAIIRARIENAKRYPARARQMQLSGTTELQFQIQSDGTVTALKVTRSSGSSLLDEAARATVKRATPLPHYPKPLSLAVQFQRNE
jgi:TonB family protein